MRKLLFLLTLMLVISCAKEPETFDELVNAGERAFVDADYFKARGYLAAAVKQKPSDRRLLYLLGLTYSRELMYDSATFYLGRADVLYPNDREINQALYEAALNCEEYKYARDALRVLVKLGDPEDQHLEMLAGLSLQIEDLPFAHYYYRQLLIREPDNPNRYVQVGNTAADIGSLQIAIAMVDSAIEKFGPNESFLSNKGTYLAAQRKYPESEAIFRSLLAEDSTVSAYRLNLASVLAGQSDPAKRREALSILRQLRTTIGTEPIIDSTIQALEGEFGEGGK
jgi:tetratricopeptide (TPR) repeat protein